MAEPSIRTIGDRIQAESLETIAPMTPASPNSTTLMTRRRQTVLSMIAAGLIGAALGLQIWSAQAGWFLATVAGLGTFLVTSGMISIALHGSCLFEAVHASVNQEESPDQAEQIETSAYMSNLKTAIALPRVPDRMHASSAVRRSPTAPAKRPARPRLHAVCAEPACV